MLVSALAQFGFGLALFWGIQQFFEKVEKQLNADTKLEVAVWLLGLRPTKAIQHWRSLFLKIFNQVFDERQFSWKCLWRSCLVTTILTLSVMLGRSLLSAKPSYVSREAFSFVLLFVSGIVSGILPDYLSLGKTRYLINLSRRAGNVCLDFLFLAVDVSITIGLAICAAFVGNVLVVWMGSGGVISIGSAVANLSSQFFADLQERKALAAIATVWFIPAFFGRAWLLLYVGCGLLLRASRRLDVGVEWFNRHFDIEDKPLTCVGLIAGACIAMGYWALAAIHALP